MNILLPCACVHVLMCTHVCVCVHECCQDLFSVSLNLYMPLHQYHHLSLQKALKSHRMILSTSSFCDNSIRLVYIYRDPDCDFNGNCLKPGKLYFAESSSSWIKCFVNYYVCSPSRALFSAYRSFVPSECLCLSISSSFGRRQRVVASIWPPVVRCQQAVQLILGLFCQPSLQNSRNSSVGLVCLWLSYILGNFLEGNVSETGDSFVSSFLSYMPLFDTLASISKITITRARPDTVGGSPRRNGM